MLLIAAQKRTSREVRVGPSRLPHRGMQRCYSIASSARPSSISATAEAQRLGGLEVDDRLKSDGILPREAANQETSLVNAPLVALPHNGAEHGRRPCTHPRKTAMQLQRLGIRWRIYAGFGSLLALGLGLAGIALWALFSVNRDVTEMDAAADHAAVLQGVLPDIIVMR